MYLLNRVDENKLSGSPLYGHTQVLAKCKAIIDKTYGDDRAYDDIFDELEIKSSFLLYGPTGTGKTTIAMQLARYALESYEVDTFEINPQTIITTALGKTVENLAKAFEEIRSKSGRGAVLFLDEFDRFMVDRNSSIEVSELKRVVISIMDFLQSLRMRDKIVVIATTNNLQSLDAAIQRRFSLSFDIQGEERHVQEYAAYLEQKLRSIYDENIFNAADAGFKTIAELKLYARQKLLNELIGVQ